MSSDCPVAIVTGAAQGIGLAVCDSLLREGYRVCLSDVNVEKGEETLALLQKEYAIDKVIFVECDVASKTSFEDVFVKTNQELGKIDLLVNNAGIADEYNYERMVEINLLGTIHGCQLALKFMGTSNGGKGGTVVNTASIVGLMPFENIPVYSATKHGVVGLTRSYGTDAHLDMNGVKFMAICPYFVRTPLIGNAKTLIPFAKERVSRAIQPEVVADGVLQLLREKRNGSTLMVLPEGFQYVELQEELQKIVL